MRQYTTILLNALKNEDTPLDVLAAFITAWSAVTKGNMLAIQIRRRLGIKEMKDFTQTFYLFLSRIKTDSSFKSKAANSVLMAIDRAWFRDFLTDIARMGVANEVRRALERLKSFGSSHNLDILYDDVKRIEEAQQIKTIVPLKQMQQKQIPGPRPAVETSIPMKSAHIEKRKISMEEKAKPILPPKMEEPSKPEAQLKIGELSFPKPIEMKESASIEKSMQKFREEKRHKVLMEELTLPEKLKIPMTKGLKEIKELLGEVEELESKEKKVEEKPKEAELKPKMEVSEIEKVALEKEPTPKEVEKKMPPMVMPTVPEGLTKPKEEEIAKELMPTRKINVKIKIITDLKEHKSRITQIKWNPVENFFVSASYDNTIVIWNADKKKKYAHLKGHQGRVLSLAWRGDGKILASGDEFGRIVIWNFMKKKKLFVLEGHKNAVNSLVWSSDGKKLYSGGRDRKLIIWSLNKEMKEERKIEFPEEITSIDASSDIIAVAHGVVVELIDPNTLLSKYSFTVDKPIKSIKISPDGKLIAIGSKGGILTIYDRLSGNKRVVKEHVSDVSSISWSSDGKYILTVGMDSRMVVWDAENLKVLKMKRMGEWITAGDWNLNAGMAAIGLWNKKILLVKIEIK